MTFQVLFSIMVLLMGVGGIFMSRKNMIAMLMGVELMLLAANCNFIVGTVYVDDGVGFMFSMVILSMAGVEASLGLSILMVYYSLRGIMTTSFMSALKG